MSTDYNAFLGLGSLSSIPGPTPCSAFNFGHTLSNFFVGGYLASGAVSPKTMLNWGAITWSLFTLLTPVAAAMRWLPPLVLVRALMGLGEGVAFPTIQAIIKNWVPPERRSRSLSLVFSGEPCTEPRERGNS